MVVTAQPMELGNAVAGAGVVVAHGEVLQLLSEARILPLEARYAQSGVVIENDEALDAVYRCSGFAGFGRGGPGPAQRRKNALLFADMKFAGNAFFCWLPRTWALLRVVREGAFCRPCLLWLFCSTSCGSGHGTGRNSVTLKQVSQVLSMGSAWKNL